MIDLSLLKHLVAAVDAGSFTQASERLYISQSGVSRSIKRLEDELGVILLERTTRKLTLTAAGQALYTEAVSSLNRLAVAVDDARRIGRGGKAKLRIGLCESAASDAGVIQRGILAFREAWPDVELIFSPVIGLNQPASLRASEIDLGVMQLNPAACHDLNWQVISRVPLTVAVPTSWKFKTNRLQLDELRDRPWLVPHPERATAAYQGVMAIFRNAGIDPTIAGFMSDRFTAHVMLGCGLGAAITYSDLSVGTIEGYEFIPLDIGGAANHIHTAIAWSSASSSEQVAGLVTCVRAVVELT